MVERETEKEKKEAGEMISPTPPRNLAQVSVPSDFAKCRWGSERIILPALFIFGRQFQDRRHPAIGLRIAAQLGYHRRTIIANP